MKKKEHFWEYIGVDMDTNDEYGYCDLCKTYRKDGLRIKITKKQYIDRYNAGKIVFR